MLKRWQIITWWRAVISATTHVAPDIPLFSTFRLLATGGSLVLNRAIMKTRLYFYATMSAVFSCCVTNAELWQSLATIASLRTVFAMRCIVLAHSFIDRLIRPVVKLGDPGDLRSPISDVRSPPLKFSVLFIMKHCFKVQCISAVNKNRLFWCTVGWNALFLFETFPRVWQTYSLVVSNLEIPRLWLGNLTTDSNSVCRGMISLILSAGGIIHCSITWLDRPK